MPVPFLFLTVAISPMLPASLVFTHKRYCPHLVVIILSIISLIIQYENFAKKKHTLNVWRYSDVPRPSYRKSRDIVCMLLSFRRSSFALVMLARANTDKSAKKSVNCSNSSYDLISIWKSPNSSKREIQSTCCWQSN